MLSVIILLSQKWPTRAVLLKRYSENMQQIYRRTYVIVFNKMFGYFKSTRIYLPVVIVITIYLTRCKIHSLSISRISNSPTKTLSFRPLSIRRPQGLCGKKSYFLVTEYHFNRVFKQNQLSHFG